MEKDGSNPVCSYDTYVSFIQDNLTQVKMLDNQDLKQYPVYNTYNNTNNNFNYLNDEYNKNTNNNNIFNNNLHNAKSLRYNSKPKTGGNFSKLFFHKK